MQCSLHFSVSGQCTRAPQKNQIEWFNVYRVHTANDQQRYSTLEAIAVFFPFYEHEGLSAVAAESDYRDDHPLACSIIEFLRMILPLENLCREHHKSNSNGGFSGCYTPTVELGALALLLLLLLTGAYMITSEGVLLILTAPKHRDLFRVARSRFYVRRPRLMFSIYKGSAWVPALPAFAGTHAPGRAGHHFDLFGSVFDRA